MKRALTSGFVAMLREQTSRGVEVPLVGAVLDALEGAQDIAREVAEDQPLCTMEGTQGDLYLCHWCRAHGPMTGPADLAIERGFTHKPDCLWLRARAFCGMGDE